MIGRHHGPSIANQGREVAPLSPEKIKIIKIKFSTKFSLMGQSVEWVEMQSTEILLG